LLIAKSCKLGALAAEAEDQNAHLLYRYGCQVGMSFQIIDDILDFTDTQKELGKPRGSDVMQGNITLPVLCAMRNHHFLKLLQRLFCYKEQLSEHSIAPLLQLLLNTDAIEESYQLSNVYLQKSLEDLSSLPAGKPKKTMQTIALYIGKRR